MIADLEPITWENYSERVADMQARCRLLLREWDSLLGIETQTVFRFVREDDECLQSLNTQRSLA